MKKIQSIGIAGAGTMGSALAQKFAQERLNVVLLDTESAFLEKGMRRIRESLKEAVERKIFSGEEAENIIGRIKTSSDIQSLAECDLVIEAIFEDFKIKSDFLKRLSEVVKDESIIATNTSSFSVNELGKSVKHPERFLGMHFFYHAAKNRLVEIVPGKGTLPEVFEMMKRFSERTGKDYIVCKDSYGFVVNRFFVPWLNEAVRLFEEGLASPSEIDEICKKVFSIGMGPFELMNATGVSIAYHAEKTLEGFGVLYKTADLLRTQAESGKNWEIDTQAAAADAESESRTRQLIRDRMLGLVFLVCSQILEEGVCTADEINRGARIGLKWRKGPVELMMKHGKQEVERLMKQIADLYGVADSGSVLEDIIYARPSPLNFVSLERRGKRAFISLSRPEDLNALNWTVVRQLSEKFQEAESIPDVKEIFITGRGKAFAAGADIKFFLDNMKAGTLDNIVAFTKFTQDVFQKIDDSQKTVVAILNGLALGGGLELALCADVILSLPNAVLAFPETGIGIYPGLGGTQRTQRRVGKELTKYLIFTGDMISAKNALAVGLIDGIIEWDDFYCMMDSNAELQQYVERQKHTDERFLSIKKLFGAHSVSEIYSGSVPDELGMVKKVKGKAPIALSIAEKLINEGRGCEGELEKIKQIFSTSDALLGLSSIGKKVEFQGK